MEFNLKKKEKNCVLHVRKIFCCCSYNQFKIIISTHFCIIREILDKQMTCYENSLIVGNFNSGITESALEGFCETLSSA